MISTMDTGQCFTQISWDPSCHFCTTFLRLCCAFFVSKSLDTGLSGTAGQKKQRARAPASSRLHLPTSLPQPMTGRVVSLLTSGQDNPDLQELVNPSWGLDPSLVPGLTSALLCPAAPSPPTPPLPLPVSPGNTCQ